MCNKKYMLKIHVYWVGLGVGVYTHELIFLLLTIVVKYVLLYK